MLFCDFAVVFLFAIKRSSFSFWVRKAKRDEERVLSFLSFVGCELWAWRRESGRREKVIGRVGVVRASVRPRQIEKKWERECRELVS